MSALFSEEGVENLSKLIGENFDHIFTHGGCLGDGLSENASERFYLWMKSHKWNDSSLSIYFVTDSLKNYMFGVSSD